MDCNNYQKAYDFMCQVKKDLKTKNRFSADERLDKLIGLYVREEHNWQTLPTDTTLYRARVYKRTDAKDRFDEPPKGTRFKGYDADNSFVKLNYENVGEGRCNPQYIPYLYSSSSVACCIHEIRPAKKAYVSVARIKVKENLRILKLKAGGCHMADTGSTILDGVQDVTMFLYLSQEFSRPHKAFGDYLLCQYVSEKVKAYGFDGIAYESAVYSGKEKTNYVIFNFEKCKPTSSSLRIISDVKIESRSLKDLSK